MFLLPFVKLIVKVLNKFLTSTRDFKGFAPFQQIGKVISSFASFNGLPFRSSPI